MFFFFYQNDVPDMFSWWKLCFILAKTFFSRNFILYGIRKSSLEFKKLAYAITNLLCPQTWIIFFCDIGTTARDQTTAIKITFINHTRYSHSVHWCSLCIGHYYTSQCTDIVYYDTSAVEFVRRCKFGHCGGYLTNFNVFVHSNGYFLTVWIYFSL